jgi:hypothetical protein
MNHQDVYFLRIVGCSGTIALRGAVMRLRRVGVLAGASEFSRLIRFRVWKFVATRP